MLLGSDLPLSFVSEWMLVLNWNQSEVAARFVLYYWLSGRVGVPHGLVHGLDGGHWYYRGHDLFQKYLMLEMDDDAGRMMQGLLRVVLFLTEVVDSQFDVQCVEQWSPWRCQQLL